MFKRLLPLAVAALSVAAFAQDAPKTIAITDVRIERGDGTVIERGTIVVRDGLIDAMGSNVAAPAGALVVPGAGMTVYPGFVDGFSTRGLKVPTQETQTARVSTLTAPATMWEKNRKGIRSDVRASTFLDLKTATEDFHKQGIVSGLLAPGNGTLRGICAVAQFLPDAAEANLPNPSFGLEASFRGGTGEGYPGNILGIIALLRQTLYDAQRYGTLDDAEKDEALAGLGPALQGSMPTLFNADTEVEILRAINIADEFGLKLILVGGREAWKQADLLKKRNIPVLLNLNVGDAPSLTESDDTEPGDRVPQAVRDAALAEWKERAANAGALEKAGVIFAFSTEGDALGDYLTNVRTAISNGLPRERALRAMTAIPAALLGLKGGTLEVGGPANIAVLDGDFADSKTRVAHVVVAGQLFEVKK